MEMHIGHRVILAMWKCLLRCRLISCHSRDAKPNKNTMASTLPVLCAIVVATDFQAKKLHMITRRFCAIRHAFAVTIVLHIMLVIFSARLCSARPWELDCFIISYYSQTDLLNMKPHRSPFIRDIKNQ